MLQKRSKEGVSAWVAYCKIMNVYVGFGIVAIPYSVASGGWCSLMLLPIMAFLAWLTAIQITRSFVVTGTNTYEDLGHAAGGRLGEWWVIITLVVLITVGCIYVGVVAQNIINAIATWGGMEPSQWKEYYGSVIFTFTLIAIVVAQAFLPWLETLCSKLGTFIIVVILFSLVGMSAINISNLPPCDPPIPLASSSFASTIAGMLLNFAGHEYLPTVWREMADPEKQFNRVTGAAFASMSIIYMLVGAVGYAGLGPSALNTYDGNAILSLREALPKSRAADLAFIIISVMFVVKLLLFVPPVFKIAVDLVLRKTLPTYLRTRPCDEDETLTQIGVQCIVIVVLVGITALGYGLREHMELVLGYSGPLLFMAQTYVIPGVFFLLLAHGQRRHNIIGGPYVRAQPLILTPTRALGWIALFLFVCGMTAYGLYDMITATMDMASIRDTSSKCRP